MNSRVLRLRAGAGMPWDHRRAGLGGGAVGHREDDGRAAADDDDDVDQKFRQHFRQLFLARFTLDSIRFRLLCNF